MNLQRPLARQESPDYPFRLRYSRHKVWIAFKNGTESKTHYARDCSATLQQLKWKKVSHVLLSQQASIDDCLRIEGAFRKVYRTLLIFRRGPDGKWPQEPIAKYVNGKCVQASDDTLPPDVRCRVLYQDPPNDAPPGTPYTFKLEPVATLPIKAQPSAPLSTADIPVAQQADNLADINSRTQALRANWKA